MRDAIRDAVIDAILNRCLLSVTCNGYKRVVEPYFLYETKSGAEILHCWQVAGEWKKTPPPHWCNLHLDEITDAALTGEHFSRPHSGYNPSGKQFHRIIVSTPVEH